MVWHIFSNEKVKHLEDSEAMDAFNNITKYECYVFYQLSDKAFKLNTAGAIKADDFNERV